MERKLELKDWQTPVPPRSPGSLYTHQRMYC
uniref:Uncharacterized protein n=1 Tax=Rhizophora mucronata TaxID=61149 RepID=A0A2P2NBI5_RHIMU